MSNQKLSVGEEMMQWAEKYWHIDKVCNGEMENKGYNEAFDYKYFRDVFVKAINEKIVERINPTPQPEEKGSIEL